MSYRQFDYMPFGKWAGYPFSEVPVDYLVWAYRENAGRHVYGFREFLELFLLEKGVSIETTQQAWDFDDPEEGELEDREDNRFVEPDPPPEAPAVVGVLASRVGEVIAAGRAALAERYNPQVYQAANGALIMEQVNAAADWLEKCKEILP